MSCYDQVALERERQVVILPKEAITENELVQAFREAGALVEE